MGSSAVEQQMCETNKPPPEREIGQTGIPNRTTTTNRMFLCVGTKVFPGEKSECVVKVNKK